ncbi:MAG: XdhC family protein [Thermoanaerobaculia bacterium]
MSGMRRILERAGELRASGVDAVLATVVEVTGSAYRREGARMLIEADGTLTGILSGGCLENDLAERAADVRTTGLPALATYDLRSPDEVLWGLGLGCGGKVTVLLERLDAAADRTSPLAPFERLEKDRQAIDVSTEFAGQVILHERLLPPIALVIAGAGRDVVPVARLARELAWDTVVLDARPTAAGRARFEGLARHLAISPRDVAQSVRIDPFTAVLLMTHNYLDDLDWLAALLPTAAPYLGLLGPATRRDRLVADLAQQGLALDGPMQSRLHGPAGLDLGGRAPEQVALAIVAEIQCAMSGASGDPLSQAAVSATVAADSFSASRH